MRPQGLKKFITANGIVYELTTDKKGLWRDKYGGFWALNDQLHFVGDPVVRCGAWPLALSPDHPLTEVCAVHDYQDSSPEFQAFNTFTDAAVHLRKLVKQTKYSFWGQTFYRLVQIRNWLVGNLTKDRNFKPQFFRKH